ncbi:P-loop containing nucleoside triphosphate hydrolase protein [Dentipellis sp. KUC8613]|nr:P-loop containing nucleoside triphosphate hydrolase protein [Dentipellis sp. KUC8613]
MARRPQQSDDDDDDSQKENTAVPAGTQVKAEKVNGAKRTANAKRAQPSPDRDDDEDAEGDEDADGEADGDEEDEEEGGSPKGRKRARVNENGDAHSTKPEARYKPKVQEAHQRDTDGFVPGSIVRVKLENFVTYDQVEFRPGPYMNMIIGPNGTGKSSIACAIALGLNYPPSILGRASELNSFVKMGTNEGFIEIELKGKIGRPNVVIRRNLSAKSKGSTFAINGTSATGKEVAQKMSELNIQVGNLCSFLPQDKVSEFAHMSPQQLLRETQRAAGDERLTAWHDTLINSGKEAKELTELLNADKQQLKTLEERNAILERDVARYNERKEIERKIALLELMLPFMEYVEARKRYGETKVVQRKLLGKVQALKKKNDPARDLQKKFENQSKALAAARDKKKKEVQKKFTAMSDKHRDNERLEENAEALSNQLVHLKKAERDRARKIHDTEKRIADIRSDLAEPGKVEDLEGIQAEQRELQASNAANRSRLVDLQYRQGVNVNVKSKAQADIQEGEASMRQLDDAAHAKLEHLKRFNRDCAEVILWLRANRGRFQMEIIEPAFVSVTVPNKQYVNAVEACFSTGQLLTFVAQCDADYKLINKLCVDTTEAIGRRARITAWYRPPSERGPPPAPMTREEMLACGFDGYAIDYVDCPEEMRYYLTREVGLHRTAIGLQAHKIDVQRATDACARTGSGMFIAGTVINNVLRSRYGKQLSQNSTRDLRQARFFVGATVDPNVKADFARRINEARQRLIMAEEESAKLADEDRAVRAAGAEFKRKNDALSARRDAVLDHARRIQRLKTKLTTSEETLKTLRNAPSADAERQTLKRKLLDVTRKRAQIAREYADLARAAITLQEEATRIGLQYLQIGSNKNALDILLQERDIAYNKAMAEFEEAHRIHAEAKANSSRKLAISRAKLDAVDDDLRAQFQAMEEVRRRRHHAPAESDPQLQSQPQREPTQSGAAHERDADEIRDELETQNQKLELVLQTNPGVVEQYERRKAEIETLTKKVAEREKKAGKVEKAIKIARDSWEPALTDLVGAIGERFSDAFDRIGCAGEIRISKHEDYDKWAIDILVKFRDNEKLQLLTAQRQSGGERSLTTILYLMSMTEQAHAPFSLVDEINQGMDVRAERTVHNELVKTTCKEDSGQYFLITPKLLPDLMYHPRMKVLCVSNGEWLPEDQGRGLGNLKNMIQGYVQKQTQTQRGPAAA